MNKNGQTLVLFIILLPLFLFCFALVIDIGLMVNAKIKGTNILSLALENNYDIESYFKDNEIKLKNIDYLDKNNKECVIIRYDIDSIFGQILGYEKYGVKVEKCK